jgi:uroporphyrinogen decarboxylase
LARITPRERILTAINHREADRVPLGYDANEGIHQRLLAHYRAADTLALYVAMGIDGFSVFTTDYVYPKYVGPKLELVDGTPTDLWGGVAFKRFPLAHAETPADLDRVRWPQADWFDYSDIKARCLALKAAGRPTVGGEGGCGIVHGINLRDYEAALTDPILRPALCDAYMERSSAFMVDWNERWLAAAEGEFDVYRCGDDVGSMTAMHLAPELWRRFHKPHLAKVWAVARRHGLKIWFHSCGYCRPIFEDLVEMGMDLWDPASPSVRDNDLPALKREYGRHVTFVGGVNHPDVLVRGTAADVVRETRLRIDQLAPGGGYISGPSQVLTDDIPTENAVALYETALAYGRY